MVRGRHRGAGDARPLAVPHFLIWQALVPIDDQATLIITTQMLERLSPSTLYGGVVLVLLMRTLGPIYLSQLQAR
jgi:hypothetical protein